MWQDLGQQSQIYDHFHFSSSSSSAARLQDVSIRKVVAAVVLPGFRI